jgi:hypothetical protein
VTPVTAGARGCSRAYSRSSAIARARAAAHRPDRRCHRGSRTRALEARRPGPIGFITTAERAGSQRSTASSIAAISSSRSAILTAYGISGIVVGLRQRVRSARYSFCFGIAASRVAARR